MSAIMQMKMKMKPFVVPNFAVMEMPPRLKQDGMRELPSFPIADLPLETLDKLVEELRQNIYEKAGKELPELRLHGELK